MKKINLLLLLACTCIFFKSVKGQNSVVKFHASYKGKQLNLVDDIMLSFKISGRTVEPILYNDSFLVPDLSRATDADVCFIIKGKQYFFNKIKVSKFETDWELGIIKKSFPKEFYLNFIPKDGGDGTRVTVKE